MYVDNASPFPHRRAFTLLEVMVAVLLTSFVVMALLTFVDVYLEAVSTMTEKHRQQEDLQGFDRFLQQTINRWPHGSAVQLLGQSHQWDTLPQDEMTFLAPAGNATFTEGKGGQYRVKLLLKKQQKGPSTLGLERTLDNPLHQGKSYWLPLLQNVQGLDIEYFDTRISSWTDEWKDSTFLPRLIRLTLWVHGTQHRAIYFIPPRGVPW